MNKREVLITQDGKCTYQPAFLSSSEARVFFEELREEINWSQDEVLMFGKRHRMKRKVAWYGDEPYQYKYSGVSKSALPWTSALIELKRLLEVGTGMTFNSCLLNLYHDGSEAMGWHSDYEKTLVARAPIASLSLGAARLFQLKHRSSKEQVKVILETGSLLLMTGSLQEHWLHRLPPSKKVTTSRINLTFRSFNALPS